MTIREYCQIAAWDIVAGVVVVAAIALDHYFVLGLFVLGPKQKGCCHGLVGYGNIPKFHCCQE
jgi:hypothetical protein